MKTSFATERRLDSVWTLEYEQVSPTQIKIVQYSRNIQKGYDEEKTLERMQLVEDGGRIVKSVLFGPYEPFSSWLNADKVTRTCQVINPDHIFSYGA